MGSRWTDTEDTAVRLAAALDWEHGGRRLVELADRLGRTEGAVRQRASRPARPAARGPGLRHAVCLIASGTRDRNYVNPLTVSGA